MPRNPANQKKKPNKPTPAIETGEERGVPQVAEPDGPAPKEEPKPPEEQPPAPPVQVIERRIETVTVEIPLGEPPHEIPNLHLNVGLTRPHAHTFARLRQALADKHERTNDGHDVNTATDALRWLMERIASC